MRPLALSLAQAALLAAAAAAPPTPPALLMRRYPLHSAAAAATACGDGSRAALFFRHCSATWDSHSGFDYCANITDDWLLVFGSDAPGALLNSSGGGGGAPGPPDAAGALCYSAASCAARDATLRSSASLPARAFPGGLVSPFAEQNANLYKAHTVVVPYCSSDLFACNASGFFGRAALDAALEQLFVAGARGVPLEEGPTMAHADRVVLAGGAGVMARLDEIAEQLRGLKRAATRNASAALDVFGLCDGCLLLDVAPPPGAAAGCTTDADCPPREALARLHAIAPLARPRWCAEPDATLWRCYLAPQLSAALAAAATPVLVSLALFDERQLRANGVADAAAPTPAERAWAEAVFAPAARAALAPHRYSFSAACAAPHALATDGEGYYHELVRFVDPSGNELNASLSQALPSFLDCAAPGGPGPSRFGRYGDTCATFACGGFCTAPAR